MKTEPNSLKFFRQVLSVVVYVWAKFYVKRLVSWCPVGLWISHAAKSEIPQISLKFAFLWFCKLESVKSFGADIFQFGSTHEYFICGKYQPRSSRHFWDNELLVKFWSSGESNRRPPTSNFHNFMNTGPCELKFFRKLPWCTKFQVKCVARFVALTTLIFLSQISEIHQIFGVFLVEKIFSRNFWLWSETILRTFSYAFEHRLVRIRAISETIVWIYVETMISGSFLKKT